MSAFQQRRQLTQNLLKPLNYNNKQGAELQINQLLHQIHSLNPQVDNYVYNNGTMSQLFKLHGTIPITYKGKQYNIPVQLWMPLDFPTMPPICYVVPVQGMKIKAKHRHVDSQGLIYHPYLHGWKQNMNPSLVELVGLLCSEFGKDPPLYSQRNNQPKPQQIIKPKNISPPIIKPQPIISPPINNNNNNNNNDKNNSIEVESLLRNKLVVIYSNENKELNSLADKQKKLDSHKDKIDSIKNDLLSEQAKLVSREADLVKKITSLEEWLKQNEESEQFDVDKVVLPCDTWSKQCIEGIASDVALTDVMLELDKALEDEIITLEKYMKQIRKCAKEQFMKRALGRAVFKKQNERVLRARPDLAQQQVSSPVQRGYVGKLG